MKRVRLLALVGLMACAKSPLDVEDDLLPLLRTSEPSYAIASTPYGVGVTIPYAFSNRTGGMVYVGGCGGFINPRMDRLVDGEWVLAYSEVELTCGATPLAISPGQVFQDTLRAVWHPDDGPHDGPLVYHEGEIQGEYRLRWVAAVEPYEGSIDAAKKLPERLSVSNSFEISEP